MIILVIVPMLTIFLGIPLVYLTDACFLPESEKVYVNTKLRILWFGSLFYHQRANNGALSRPSRLLHISILSHHPRSRTPLHLQAHIKICLVNMYWAILFFAWICIYLSTLGPPPSLPTLTGDTASSHWISPWPIAHNIPCHSVVEPPQGPPYMGVITHVSN